MASTTSSMTSMTSVQAIITEDVPVVSVVSEDVSVVLSVTVDALHYYAVDFIHCVSQPQIQSFTPSIGTTL